MGIAFFSTEIPGGLVALRTSHVFQDPQKSLYGFEDVLRLGPVPACVLFQQPGVFVEEGRPQQDQRPVSALLDATFVAIFRHGKIRYPRGPVAGVDRRYVFIQDVVTAVEAHVVRTEHEHPLG